tara:strand:+ start:109 stop:3882 length:3774 start_codon:yes stop_codon:yes gene_type:complete
VKVKIALYTFFLTLNFNLLSQELCPPVALTVFGGDQENIVSWNEPIGNIGCGDFAVDELPFSDIGTNVGTGNNWPVSGSEGDDVAYTLNVSTATTFDITTCSGNTDFDTKLEIFTNNEDCNNPVTTGNYNDDDFECENFQSSLLGVTLQPGQYYVVVDGYGGATGNYELSISISGRGANYDIANNYIKFAWPLEILKMEELGVSQSQIEAYTNIVMDPERYRAQSNSRDIPEECGTFNTYRVYNGADNTMLAETTDLTFTHSNLINGEEYCYYVLVAYEEGDSEVTDTQCGTPSTFTPLPPTNLFSEVWDEEVSLYWTAPDVLQLGIPYYEDFSEEGLIDLWLIEGDGNWYYNDIYGSPEPCFAFNWSPTATNYEQSLISPSIPLGTLTNATVSCDIELDNYSPSGGELLALEYKTGNDQTWYEIETFDNSGDGFTFTNYSYDLTNLSGNVQVRFRCYGASSFDIDWWAVDNFSVTSDNRTSRNEYDFLGYNVYVNDVLANTSIFDSTNYTVAGLDNEQQYTFGVTSVYEGAAGEDNYESTPATVVAQPVYVYGDITGFVTDPNGAYLDSVTVSAGGVSFLTGPDGEYILYNLDVGINTVNVQKAGFYVASEEVTVLAQADPTIQNFVLSPDMPSPVGLNATPMDEEVYLEWREPGGMTFYDIAYYDEEFEGQIGCGGPCQFAVRFTPPNYPATLTGLVLSFQGGANAVGASVEVYLDPDGLVSGPVGDPINLITSADLSAPDELVQYQFDVSGEAVQVYSGDIYVVVNENESGFMGISNDLQPQSSEYYDRNWVALPDYYGGLTWDTIENIVGGDVSLTGDFGILAQFLGAPGLTYAMNASGITDPIENPVSSGLISNFNNSDIIVSDDENPGFLIELDELYQPINPTSLNRNRDDLIEYRVYEVDENDNETFLVATTDTFVTVSASPNYVDYCYNVSAYWATDNYGDLESRHSNTACAEPYAFGDADFDSDCDITDVISVIDFILEVTVPNEEEFRNVDVNMDDQINIADVIMMVDIIFGGTARTVDFDPNETAFVDLLTNYSDSELSVNIDYQGFIRGLEFELKFDPNLVKTSSPILNKYQENIMVSFDEIEPGLLKVLIADLSGGFIESEDQSFIKVPVDFIGIENDVANISIQNINIAGLNGSLINYITGNNSSEFKVLPSEFILHQNFPNPFNPSTEIRFDLPNESFVSLTIHNLIGQKVRTLNSKNMSPGFHSMIWNGTDDFGTPVSSGMYFYSINAKEFKSTKKMLFLK